MWLFLLVIFCATSETFYTVDQVENFINSSKSATPEASFFCTICQCPCDDDCIMRQRTDNEIFVTEIISCKNETYKHFLHKNCIFNHVINSQECQKSVTCPACRQQMSINTTLILREELFLMLRGQACCFPDFLELIYSNLKENILTFLDYNTSVEDLISFKQKIQNSESPLKSLAEADLNLAITAFRTPINNVSELMAEIEKCSSKDINCNKIIMLLILNFFKKLNPHDFISMIEAHAITSPFYSRMLGIAFGNLSHYCLKPEQVEKLIYDFFCSERSWLLKELDNNGITKTWIEGISLFELLEKKINANLSWILNEQKYMALTESIAFCARNSEHKDTKAFFYDMINKCFTAKIQNFENNRYPARSSIVIEVIGDYYGDTKNQYDAENGYPWLVYDYICVRTFLEFPTLANGIFELFNFLNKWLTSNTHVGLKYYYFLNRILLSSQVPIAVFRQLLDKSNKKKEYRKISMILRHSFKRHNIEDVIAYIRDNYWEEVISELFNELIEQEDFVNYKNYEALTAFAQEINNAKVQEKLLKKALTVAGLWKFIPEDRLDKYCETHIRSKEYSNISILIFGCNNPKIIKMLTKEAVEEIIGHSDFFIRIYSIYDFFKEAQTSSLFVRLHFIQIFEMASAKYSSIRKERLMHFSFYLYVCGFNNYHNFKKYKPVFEYICKRDDAYELLNTSIKPLSDEANLSRLKYITKLIDQKKNFFTHIHADSELYKTNLDEWYANIDKIDASRKTHCQVKAAYNWCIKLEEKETCSEKWNPYIELRKPGMELFNKMKYYYNHDKYKFANLAISYIPKDTVNEIKAKLKKNEERA
ncbi:hypothetical protein ENBRE01_2513 [Enteropsectra breve]|nr:hypothetical protein ENBRE01_2513 [Enteropsectra breve]